MNVFRQISLKILGKLEKINGIYKLKLVYMYELKCNNFSRATFLNLTFNLFIN